LGFWVHVEVDFSGFPFFAGFDQKGRDQTQEGGFVGKEAGDAGAALEFLIHPFQCVGGAHFLLVRGGQAEDREALREVFLQPGGEFGSTVGVVGDDFLEAGFGGRAAGAVKDAADGTGNFGALVQSGHVGLSVLLEVELAALPRHGGEDGGASRLEAAVIVTGDAGDAAETALEEALEEGAPVDFGFTEGDAHAEEGAFAVGGDAHGDQDGTIEQLAVLANFFIPGIDHKIGIVGERPRAPFVEFDVEELGAGADLGRTDGSAAEFFDDGGDFPGRDALDVHFGEGEFEGLFTAAALFEGGGVEVQIAPDLWNVKGDGAEAGGEGFVLKAIGVTGASERAFVGFGLEGLGTFDVHGLIDEQADAFGEAIGALFGDQLQNVVQ